MIRRIQGLNTGQDGMEVKIDECDKCDKYCKHDPEKEDHDTKKSH